MKTRSFVVIWMLWAALVFVSACSARSNGASQTQSGTRDLITESELSEVNAVEAYTAIQQLRPFWLRTRGTASFTNPGSNSPTVYVDNMRLGELATLHAIPIDEIAEIHYISGPDATTRWGTGVLGGVIEVIRKR
jgi:hypothetical protein